MGDCTLHAGGITGAICKLPTTRHRVQVPGLPLMPLANLHVPFMNLHDDSSLAARQWIIQMVHVLRYSIHTSVPGGRDNGFHPHRWRTG